MAKEKAEITAAMEDYLETIADLKKKSGIAARVRDISRQLNVKSPTVNAALKALAEKGFVVHERYGAAQLTDKGKTLARKIQNRHDALTDFLTGVLGVDRKTAAEDACKIEHVISQKTMNKIIRFKR